MPLSQLQLEVKAYVQENPDAVSVLFAGVTKPISDWFSDNTTNGDQAVSDALNGQTIGAGAGKTVKRTSIDGNKIVDAIIASDDFAGMQPATLAQLAFAVGRGPFVATDDAVAGMGRVLAPFVAAKQAFDAQKIRPSSIYESLSGSEGASISRPEVNALHGA